MKTSFRLLLSAAIGLAVSLASISSLRAADATVYQLNAQPLAQISGSPGAAAVKPTFAASLTLNQNAGMVQQLNGVSTTSATCAVTVGGAGNFGQLLIVICSADSSGTVTYTFSNAAGKFLPTATAAPTAGTSITVAFVSDGTVWHEFARSASAQ